MTSAAAAVILVVVGGLAALIGTLEFRRLKRRRFVGRTPLDGRTFYYDYYRGTSFDEAVVVQVRDYVAGVAEIAPGLLRPTDRFAVELAAPRGWESHWEDGIALLQEQRTLQIGRVRRSIDWSQTHTLDDLIRWFASVADAQ